jgi:hypothetical protein
MDHRSSVVAAGVFEKTDESSAVDSRDLKLARRPRQGHVALESAPECGLSRQRSKVRGVAKDLDLRLVVHIHFKRASSRPSAASDGSAARDRIGM